MTLRSAMWPLVVLMVLAGCGDDDGPTAGSGGSGGTSGSGGTGGSGGSGPATDCVTVTTPTRAATFDAIYDEVLCDETNSCTSSFCHGGTGSGELRLDRREAAYTALVNHAAASAECEASGLSRVVPGDADASLLIQKLLPDPPCGEVMPLLTDMPVPAVQIDQIRAWINAGALRHPPAEMDAGPLDASDYDSGL